MREEGRRRTESDRGKGRNVADKKLKSIFKQAAEIAQGVPEELQEIAFNRALDKLMGDTKSKAGAKKKVHIVDAEIVDDEDETGFTETILNRSLDAMNFAAERFGLEGMSVEQITDLLDERFGINTSAEVVGRVLEGADTIVGRVRGHGGTLYRLVIPGAKAPKKSTAKKSSKAKAKTKAKTKAKAKSKAAKRAPKKADASAGLVGMIIDLIGAGFFATARTVGDIMLYLQRKGLEYTAAELTSVLVRLLSKGLLTRQRTTTGDYEYEAR